MRFSRLFTRVLRISVLSLAGLMLALGIITPQPSQAQGLTLYSVANNDDLLRVIDPSSGATLSSVTITFAGDTVDGATGLARNPVTDELFALLKLASAVGVERQLVILDPTTGVATDVGDTGDGFAAITFDSSGTLFAVTGDGANTDPESLFTLDTTDATPTLVGALGNGDDGETIAFNPVDGLIYHTSGIGILNDPNGRIFESIDTATSPLTITSITLTTDVNEEMTALTHWAGNLFLVADRSNATLSMISTKGFARPMVGSPASIDGQMDHRSKGLAFLGSPPTCPPLGNLYGAAHQRQDGPSLLYQIDPATGNPTLVGPIGFERVSAMDFVGDATNATFGGTLFATGERQDFTDENVLLTIDPCTGLGTEVAPTNILAVTNEVEPGMSMRSSDGTLFAVFEFQDVLGTIDTTTGLAAVIGPIFAGGRGHGLAFSGNETLFHADDTQLSTLDPGTGLATPVMDFIFVAPADLNPRFNALDFQLDTGILFGSLNDGSGGAPENHLATIDTTTADITFIGQTQDGLDALAFRPPDFDVSGPATATVSRGGSTTLTVTVRPLFGAWADEVTLTCASSNTGASCSFDTPMVTPDNASVDVTLTVNAANLAMMGPISFNWRQWAPLYALLLAGLSGLVLLWIVRFVPAGRRRKLVLYPALMVVFAAGLAGCGDDAVVPPAGPAAINFDVDITATADQVVRSTTVQVTAN